ncbi:phosphatase PAP2 family protein [Hydrogenophaga intermedia]|uniref:phosphatase PAP2 family protein n=1 Tax=Hydrogenophaga intermedia TaxID=65786 RepID=UPI00204439C5|nr:phosphatase PAP2 family protein [Hydrogenophaga intermedia]MCM3566389.1 hypothetical protein [Hydrogenophaga intermedia]
MRVDLLRASLRAGSFEWWLLTGSALYLLVLWDFFRLDAVVMSLIGTRDGFPLRHSYWLEQIGHSGARNLALLLLILLWIAVVRAPRWLETFNRQERLFMVVTTTLCALVVGTIKQFSVVSCPWDQAAFGGSAHWIPHWAWWITTDGGPGRCFPGGHVSSAFAFMAAAWPGLASGIETHRWRYAIRILTVVGGAGVALGVVQTLRGAHPPSHTLWTAWLCWFLSGLLYAIFAKRITVATKEHEPFPAITSSDRDGRDGRDG